MDYISKEDAKRIIRKNLRGFSDEIVAEIDKNPKANVVEREIHLMIVDAADDLLATNKEYRKAIEEYQVQYQFAVELVGEYVELIKEIYADAPPEIKELIKARLIGGYFS